MTCRWTPAEDNFGFFSSLSRAFAAYEEQFPTTFPDLRPYSSLFLASDYSGDDRAAQFDAIAFLVTPISHNALWKKQRKIIRDKFLSDGRTLSYKKLGDIRRSEALPHFLEAANALEGLIVVILVDKKIHSLFDSDAKYLVRDPKLVKYAHWNVQVFEKAYRVVHFASCILAGLAQPGQNLLWISDNDSIMSNDQRLDEFYSIFIHVLSEFNQFQFQRVAVETTRIDKYNKLLEDFVAIPDLVAGALVHVLDEWVELIGALKLGISVPVPPQLQPKTKKILQWLDDDSQPLRRFFLVIDQDQTTKKLNAMVLRFHSEQVQIF